MHYIFHWEQDIRYGRCIYDWSMYPSATVTNSTVIHHRALHITCVGSNANNDTDAHRPIPDANTTRLKTNDEDVITCESRNRIVITIWYRQHSISAGDMASRDSCAGDRLHMKNNARRPPMPAITLINMSSHNGITTAAVTHSCLNNCKYTH
jgi:hypothetical protein